jgi:uncharacterized radical SAM superfamily Fe-S cluster-containing enzyme
MQPNLSQPSSSSGSSSYPPPDPTLIAHLEEYLRTALREQLAEQVSVQLERFVFQNEQRAKEVALMERVVRVEEELKHLREVQTVQFKAISDRFDALQREMDKRFEAMDKRFEAVDKRFSQMQWTMMLGFTMLGVLIGVMGYLGM